MGQKVGISYHSIIGKLCQHKSKSVSSPHLTFFDSSLRVSNYKRLNAAKETHM